MGQVQLVEGSFKEISSDQVCFNRPYHFKFLKGSLPQTSLGPFLKTPPHMTSGEVNVLLD